MWLRLLSLVFGVTVYAASTVLAGFMAGLGVGSFLAGRLARRIRQPLAAFGVAEILVGGTAFLTPIALSWLTQLWVSLHGSLPDSPAAITVIRFIVAFLVLIVPTSLMGATLPLIVKSAIAREDRIGGKIGLLYAINTTGAIAGALIAGFYFIAEIGVARSFQIAAATNIAIGLIAFAASYLVPTSPAQAPAPGTKAPYAPQAPYAPYAPYAPGSRLVLWVFFVSGLMSLA